MFIAWLRFAFSGCLILFYDIVYLAARYSVVWGEPVS